jgi:hypothetical protein
MGLRGGARARRTGRTEWAPRVPPTGLALQIDHRRNKSGCHVMRTHPGRRGPGSGEVAGDGLLGRQGETSGLRWRAAEYALHRGALGRETLQPRDPHSRRADVHGQPKAA